MPADRMGAAKMLWIVAHIRRESWTWTVRCSSGGCIPLLSFGTLNRLTLVQGVPHLPDWYFGLLVLHKIVGGWGLCAVFRQEVSLLNEADVNAVIVETESKLMRFCHEAVCVPL